MVEIDPKNPDHRLYISAEGMMEINGFDKNGFQDQRMLRLSSMKQPYMTDARISASARWFFPTIRQKNAEFPMIYQRIKRHLNRMKNLKIS